METKVSFDSNGNIQIDRAVSALLQSAKDASKSKKMTVPSHSRTSHLQSKMATRKLCGKKLENFKAKIEKSEKAKTSFKEVKDCPLLEDVLCDITTKNVEEVEFFGEGWFEAMDQSFVTKPVNLEHLQGHMEIMLVALYNGLRAYCSDTHVELPKKFVDIPTFFRSEAEKNIQIWENLLGACKDRGTSKSYFETCLESCKRNLENFDSKTANDFVCKDYMCYIQDLLRYILFKIEDDESYQFGIEEEMAAKALSPKLLPYLHRELQNLQGNSEVDIDELSRAISLLRLN